MSRAKMKEEEKRNVQLNIRVTEKEMTKIKEMAKKKRKLTTTFIIDKLLDRK